MNNIIYKHKFGGRAVIKDVRMSEGEETTFIVQLLDENVQLCKRTLKLTEDEFHKDFKIHGIDFKEDMKTPKTKQEALDYLKEYNTNNNHEGIITRLYYNDKKDFVQDFSFFANSNYMSFELLEALQKGRTLTGGLVREFNQFIIEKSV